MEEFIENFCQFREWLHEYDKSINPTTEAASAYEDIISKFAELGLDDAF